ncbi:MAG: Omp28-related outer membrane protein [Muribaculaceae bacterium]|nr:Omp28-related outer membrane protein [Muribaculaceae bacterium]
MRKNLLLFGALAIALPALATAPNQQMKRHGHPTSKATVTNPLKHSRKVKDILKPGGMVATNDLFKATRAEETLNMHWGYCYDPATAENFEDNEVNQAIYVAPEFTEMLDGAVLKSILTANPADASAYDEVTDTYGNPVKTCKVWVKESLDGDPITEGEGELGEYAFDWSSISLTTPYTIQKDKPFYVGISYTLPADNPYAYGYVTDFAYPAEYDDTNLIYSAFIGYDEEWEPMFGSERKWTNIGLDDGNACIRLDVYGDNLPQNIAVAEDSEVPAYVAPGNKVEVFVAVTNKAANSIKDVEISLQYDGEEPQKVSAEILNIYDLLPEAIAYGYTGLAIAEFDSPKTEGNFGYTLKITKINGEAENNSDSESTGNILCLAEGYHKNVVVEEGTGLWCGYCPVGIAGMEYVKENFTEDGVIGVAIHGGDVMDVLYYGVFSPIEPFFKGFPSCFYNRNFAYSGYPSPDEIDLDLSDLIEIPSCASIEAKLEATDDKSVLKLSTKTEFLLSGEEGEYEIGYTVLEDGVGPYLQTNYLSGMPDDKSYGFGSKSNPFLTKFNDVARNCSKPMGIEGSLPAVEKGNSYDYSCDVALDDVKNVKNCRVVAMVINKKSGFIENATVVESPTYDFNGVDEISATKSASFARGVKGAILIDGDNSNVNIYSASGMKVAKANGFRVNLPAGIYVVTRGSESTKVIVK